MKTSMSVTNFLYALFVTLVLTDQCRLKYQVLHSSWFVIEYMKLRTNSA